MIEKSHNNAVYFEQLLIPLGWLQVVAETRRSNL